MRMVQKRMLLFGAYFALLHSMGTPCRKQAKSARNRSILCLYLPNGSLRRQHAKSALIKNLLLATEVYHFTRSTICFILFNAVLATCKASCL